MVFQQSQIKMSSHLQEIFNKYDHLKSFSISCTIKESFTITLEIKYYPTMPKRSLKNTVSLSFQPRFYSKILENSITTVHSVRVCDR